jgi:beta-galactosidase
MRGYDQAKGGEMADHPRVLSAATLCALLSIQSGLCEDDLVAPLPAGVKAVWELEKAYREATPTRERICLNGLWRWQPAGEKSEAVPRGGWGHFKVPGSWPGMTDYMQKDCQTVFAHPGWKDRDLRAATAAWHQREVSIPGDWAGRRIVLSAEYLNSLATLYLDGQRAGEIGFPGGEVDLTALCRPGRKHLLSMRVEALPLKTVLLSYSDTASAREVKGKVARRGLCGDVYLVSTPAEARIAEVKVDTSVREWRITFSAALLDLAEGRRYLLHALITEEGRTAAEFTSRPFDRGSLENGRMSFSEKWKPGKLWDLHTPGNTYLLSVSLVEAGGQVRDTGFSVRFGFREFWIEGRDFFLNRSRIFLSAVPLDNAQVGAAPASYEGARESLERLKKIGINFVYTHNYDCEPGSHLSFAEILRAADDVGILVSLTQPHFAGYDWKVPDADRKNGYARHAEFYVRAAQDHPSVVAYAMSHNATGYSEDMNPDLMDGVQDPRDSWALNNSKLALRAEAIVRRLDSARLIYHHASGNLGSLHTTNFYPNFAPIQELSDWFEHWAARGVKPVFTCEYGAPFTWDWAMYRGWYQGERSFGSARVPWEFCFAEWNSQFLGDRAFRISEVEKANLRWEARQFRAGNLWHRWDYPYEIGSRLFDDREEVLALYLADNWRAFRTWGVSGISPWEYGHFWKPRDGLKKGRKELAVDWDHLERPGMSPDYLQERCDQMDLAFERSDWIPTAAGRALLRNNRPLLAYLGGKPARFTSKDHNFHPGEAVEKQIIVINNSRESVDCDCEWSFGLPRPVTGRRRVTLETGRLERVPLRFELPAAAAPGGYELSATVRFTGGGEPQSDSFTVHVLAPPAPVPPLSRVALFDPAGETGEWLRGLGVSYQPVDAGSDLSPYGILVVGKKGLTVDGPAPDITGVREGLKVIVFEQTSAVLEKRFGFRVAEYGLRRVFRRLSDHPLLAGIEPEHLRDWRGEATLLPPRLEYEMRPRYGPTVKWCDLPVTRVWRCGNRGSVASVLIEKPARGDFLPVLDGGYSLQYSPLLEYREGKGVVLFCQLDLTGRSEVDPAASILARNILNYIATWKPAPRRKALYAGDPAGSSHLESAGLSVASFAGGQLLDQEQVLIVGPGGGAILKASAPAVAGWLEAGGRLLAIGLDEEEASAFLPLKVGMRKAEHIASFFEPFAFDSLLRGVGPADVHNRDPRDFPLVSKGARVIGDGILAHAEKAKVVFCQVAPWQIDRSGRWNVKRTFRRASFLLSRLLANLGVAGATPLLDRFRSPLDAARPEKRWLDGMYLDQPEEMDDPYRFFRW